MPDYFPFSVVDREPRRESSLVDCFFDLLEFFEGRATNREVLDLLDSTVFRQGSNWRIRISIPSGIGFVIAMPTGGSMANIVSATVR